MDVLAQAGAQGSIQLFTIISLMIGLFGSTYAVILNLYKVKDDQVKNAKLEGKEHLRVIKAIPGATTLQSDAEENFRKVIWWANWWRRLRWVPTILFAVFIYITGGFICVDGSENFTLSMYWCRWGIVGVMVIYLLCIIAPYRVLRRIKGYAGRLEVNRKGAGELQQKDIIPRRVRHS